jgi:hypothetical protein
MGKNEFPVVLMSLSLVLPTIETDFWAQVHELPVSHFAAFLRQKSMKFCWPCFQLKEAPNILQLRPVAVCCNV